MKHAICEVLKMKLLTLFALVLFAFAACERPPATSDNAPPPGTSGEIAPADALPRTQAAYSQFFDVRTPAEYASGHAARARNIPQDKLLESLVLIEKNEPVYLICQTGRRSGEAAELLRQNGYTMVYNISGGTSAWEQAGLPMEKPVEGK